MSVIAAVEPNRLSVEPGGTVTARIRIRNQSERVDGFRLDVVGDPGGWSSIEPAEIELFPRTEGEATLTFAPPRASSPRAGVYPFGVRAVSRTNPEASTVEEGDVTVGPFVAIGTDAPRRIARGWRSGAHVVDVTNTGNDVASVAAFAKDPEEQLRLSVNPAQGRIEPGASLRIQSVVSRAQLQLVGASKRWPYTVEVEAAGANPESVPVVFEQRAILPTWAIPVAGLALAAIVAFALWPKGDGGETQPPGGSQGAVTTPGGGGGPTPDGGTGPTPTPDVPVEPTPVQPYFAIVMPPQNATSFSLTNSIASRDENYTYVSLIFDWDGDSCSSTLILTLQPEIGTQSITDYFDTPAPWNAIFCNNDGEARWWATSGNLELTSVDPMEGSYTATMTNATDLMEVRGGFVGLSVVQQ